MNIWIIFGVFALASYLISNRLESKFKKYSKIPMNYGMTGREVAEKMLRDNDIYDVKVVSTPGTLTDHYNPAMGIVGWHTADRYLPKVTIGRYMSFRRYYTI